MRTHRILLFAGVVASLWFLQAPHAVAVDPNSPCSGYLTVGVSVIGGTASASDARLYLDGAGILRDSQYNVLNCATHALSADPLPGYTTSWSGDCDASGGIAIESGISKTCTAVFTSTSASPTPVATPTPTPSVSPTPSPSLGGSLSAAGLHEGDTVSAAGSSDPDVYIVNVYGYKRLFLNPAIFSFYGHLGGFARVKTITPAVRDSFGTSGLFRNCETNDQAVYGVEATGEDTGILHHINITGDAAVAQDPEFFKKVFCINTNEFNWYTKGSDYTSLSQVPVYSR